MGTTFIVIGYIVSTIGARATYRLLYTHEFRFTNPTFTDLVLTLTPLFNTVWSLIGFMLALYYFVENYGKRKQISTNWFFKIPKR